ncbi:hypothetical protein CFOL_v3_07529 [Cephalotus follicularis]|uniref:HMA domain-containing protein n=1 Tax=Cephalotus follicularis TaxID=3775 RepID=A0A1Q3B7J3_CEPFO|nr:hypothetical protein CFOL_v3_07529 [Cephalotus follicularis]
MSPTVNMTCGFKVNTQSPKWYTSLRKVLKEINGASYSIDVEEGMAYITGKVNPVSLLKKLQKSNKSADLSWVMTGNNMDGNGKYDNYERYLQEAASYINPYWNLQRQPGIAPHYPPPVPYDIIYGHLPLNYSYPPIPPPNYGYPPIPPPNYGYQPFVYDPNAFWHRNTY